MVQKGISIKEETGVISETTCTKAKRVGFDLEETRKRMYKSSRVFCQCGKKEREMRLYV
jgi:hypothetical protein